MSESDKSNQSDADKDNMVWAGQQTKYQEQMKAGNVPKHKQEQYDMVHKYDNVSAAEQEQFIHRINEQVPVNNVNRTDVAMNPVEDYLANYLFNFMKCSVIFQVPLILITPILQMLLLVNNYCIDTANESKNVSQIISV
eukprot:58323_1